MSVPSPCCPEAAFGSEDDSQYPRVWLADLKGMLLPECGEITFTFKRKRLEGVLSGDGNKLSADLCLKSILSVKETESDEEEYEEDERADDVVEKLFEGLSEADLVPDESEDDNQDKY